MCKHHLKKFTCASRWRDYRHLENFPQRFFQRWHGTPPPLSRLNQFYIYGDLCPTFSCTALPSVPKTWKAVMSTLTWLLLGSNLPSLDQPSLPRRTVISYTI